MTPTHPKFDHLEDFCEDIIAKAQSGLRMTNRELSDRARVELSGVKNLKSGAGSATDARAVASALGLDPERLTVSLRKAWLPRVQKIPGLTTIVSEFRSMTVNAYILEGEPDGCLIVDTGVNATPIIEHLRSIGKSPDAILLTHAHPDHIAALPRIREEFPDAEVRIHPHENFGKAQAMDWGETLRIGSLTLETLRTPGHTPGGTSFLVRNHAAPLCFVGDSLFAGSVGGCAPDYVGALTAIRRNLLSLPPETILCPGHGPITSVGEEIEHNPFFPPEEDRKLPA